MSLRVAISFCAAAVIAQPVWAGPADDVVDQVLNAYLDTCSRAFSDPADYLSALQIPGPSGEKVVVRTPDDQIVWVLTSQGDLMEDVQIVGVPGTLQISCVLTKTMTAPVTNGPELGAAVAQKLSERQNVVLVGGDAPHEQPNVIFGGAGVTPVGDSYVFAASGLFEQLEIVTQIEAHTSYFALSGLHRMKPE